MNPAARPAIPRMAILRSAIPRTARRLAARSPALLAGAAFLLAGVAAGRAADCTEIGAIYRARPTLVAHPDPNTPLPAYRYQLRIGLLPPGAFASAVAELYRFEAVALRSSRMVSELRMLRSCGVGCTPCIVSPPSHPRLEDGYASEAVELDRDLSIDVRQGAPYAIVLPGLPQADWSPDLVRDRLRADLRFFTRERVVPDLGLQELWVRARCGG